MAHNRGGKNTRLIPVWKSNLIRMYEHKTRVRCSCRKCRIMLEVDIRPLMAYHGEHFSLWDKVGRCKVVGCDGEVFFLAATENGPFTPLVTKD